jgi:7,8-dihydropterin-6-yl-methyl-4-(beta-D-ribofuranosyl)aminobenzene 5'-phosphate synthase
MKLNLTSVIAGALACAVTLAAVTETALSAESKITILYDAFGDDAAMKKDWGFSAFVEVAGKRILFDTGNDRDIFAANVKAKNIDLTNLDFVVLSHRHSDHMAGLSHVLSVNPKVKIYAPREGFGIYGSSLPSSFYRKDESLPPQMRYYDGKPPEVMTFGTAWQGAPAPGNSGSCLLLSTPRTASCSWSPARTRGSTRSLRRRRPSIPKST